MVEALEWAADYCDRTGIFAPVTNSRGYADGWKPPTPEEKRQIITKVARDACDEGPPITQSAAIKYLREGVLTNLIGLESAIRDPNSYSPSAALAEVSAIIRSVSKYVEGK